MLWVLFLPLPIFIWPFPITLLRVQHCISLNLYSTECTEDEFRCDNGWCTHISNRCNGEDNCYSWWEPVDRSDEEGCDDPGTTDPGIANQIVRPPAHWTAQKRLKFFSQLILMYLSILITTVQILFLLDQRLSSTLVLWGFLILSLWWSQNSWEKTLDAFATLT